MNEYYTYAYLTEDRKPYYIGKGKGNRYKRHTNAYDAPCPQAEFILILKRNLSEDEAWKHEEYLIAVYGRKSEGGLLLNRTRGGKGWGGGSVASPERKKKIGDANRGRRLTKEHRQKLSDAKRGTKVSPTAIKARAKNIRRPISLINPAGVIVNFSSSNLAAEVIGVNHSCISRLRHGKNKTTKGWALA